MKEKLIPIPDPFWTYVRKEMIRQNWEDVDQLIDDLKAESLDFDKHPEGDATVKREILKRLNERI